MCVICLLDMTSVPDIYSWLFAYQTTYLLIIDGSLLEKKTFGYFKTASLRRVCDSSRFMLILPQCNIPDIYN